MYGGVIHLITSVCGEYLKQSTCYLEDTYVKYPCKKELLAYLVLISIPNSAKHCIAKQ